MLQRIAIVCIILRVLYILHDKWQWMLFSPKLIKNLQMSECSERVSEFLINECENKTLVAATCHAEFPFLYVWCDFSGENKVIAVEKWNLVSDWANAFLSLWTLYFHCCYLIEIAPNIQEICFLYMRMSQVNYKWTSGSNFYFLIIRFSSIFSLFISIHVNSSKKFMSRLYLQWFSWLQYQINQLYLDYKEQRWLTL